MKGTRQVQVVYEAKTFPSGLMECFKNYFASGSTLKYDIDDGKIITLSGR